MPCPRNRMQRKAKDRDEKERYRVVKELLSLGVEMSLEQASKDVSDINTMLFELQP